LGAAGASILFTQYVSAREIGSTFLSTEIVLLAATLITLVGPSLAYAFGHLVPDRLLALWGCLSVAIILALPVGLRALVGEMAARRLEGWALFGTLIFGGLSLSGFYAVFLPRAARAPTSLRTLYAAELAGAVAALVILYLSPSYRASLALSWAAAVLVLHLGLRRRAVTIPALAAAAAMVLAYPILDRAAARRYYEGHHGVRSPTVVETEHSAHQRIDVVDDARGRRALYLDGVWFFGSGSFDGHNRFLSELPGALHPGRGPALVVGSGSFSSAAHLRHQGYDVTVVELDEAVARIGFSRFEAVHRLRPGDVRVVIADGRRFLAETGDSYDVIALDVPAPYQVRTALLYTAGFFRLVASRLRPGGVAAISLSGSASGEVGRSIAAAALEAFPSVIAVESEQSGLAHLYGGAPLPFSADAVASALGERDPLGGRVYGDAEVRALARGVAPLTEARLVPVLLLSREALGDLFDGS
jgi:spermidine synthase